MLGPLPPPLRQGRQDPFIPEPWPRAGIPVRDLMEAARTQNAANKEEADQRATPETKAMVGTSGLGAHNDEEGSRGPANTPEKEHDSYKSDGAG